MFFLNLALIITLVDTNISSPNVNLLHAYVLIFSMNVSSIFGIHFLMTSLTLIHFISLNVASKVLICHITLDFAIGFLSFLYVFSFLFIVILFGQLLHALCFVVMFDVFIYYRDLCVLLKNKRNKTP